MTLICDVAINFCLMLPRLAAILNIKMSLINSLAKEM